MTLSARTPTALDAATARLADHLAEDAGDTALADVAATLQVGRRTFEHRRVLVCRDRGEAVRGLRGEAPGRLLTAAPGVRGRPVAFLLPGIGEHYPGMGAGLYEHEAAFRAAIDECAALAEPQLGRDLRELLFPAGAADAPAAAGLDLRGLLGRAPRTDPAMDELTRTLHAHAAVFAVEYALARLWASWGVEPVAMIGHSLGEYVAATLAGVVSLADVLRLVAARARRIDELPGGAMLAVTLPAAEVEPRLGAGVWLSAVNGPRVTVVAGEEAAVAALAAVLAAEGVVASRLPARHAFHSPLMEPAAEAVAAGFRECALKAPEIPFISGVSGRFITAAEATDPEYWTRHLCRPVRFADGLARLLREHEPVLLEVGPGQGLGALALQSPAAAGAAERVVVPALRGRHERHDDQAFALAALGRLWLAGATVDWRRLHAGEERRRIALPTYPFERRRFWIDRDPGRRETAAEAPAPAARERHERPYLATAYAAPESELQQRIAAAWQETLGVSPVGLHDSFFDLGGHSLLAPRLLLRLEQATEVALPVPALLGHPTVAELAELVEQVRREGLDAVATARVDLAAEVTLTEEVRVTTPWDAAGAGPPRTVLVTGGTGFLGAHLVAELLAQTGARLCCLARGGDERAAFARLRANLEHHRVWRPDAAARLEAVAGDLAKPRFGLSGDAFRELADRVDAVYHAGAWVNFTYPYGALAPANVGGTREALRLAASGGRARPFHFVSSVAVFAPAGLEDGVGYEDAALAETEGLFSGYAETKWVGEKIVGLARERGVPAVVYRPGVIAGDSRSGVGNASDMVWNVIKGCIELGAACAELPTLDVAPVDYVARAIVHLSLAAASAGRAFHFSAPRPMPWSEVFDVVRAMGYPVRPIPYREWRGELVAAARAGRDNALVPFLPLFPEPPAAGGEVPDAAEIPTVRYDDRQAVAALADSGIRCPPLDAALVRSYLGYFVAGGFIEPP